MLYHKDILQWSEWRDFYCVLYGEWWCWWLMVGDPQPKSKLYIALLHNLTRCLPPKEWIVSSGNHFTLIMLEYAYDLDAGPKVFLKVSQKIEKWSDIVHCYLDWVASPPKWSLSRSCVLFPVTQPEDRFEVTGLPYLQIRLTFDNPHWRGWLAKIGVFSNLFIPTGSPCG